MDWVFILFFFIHRKVRRGFGVRVGYLKKSFVFSLLYLPSFFFPVFDAFFFSFLFFLSWAWGFSFAIEVMI